uniref:Uncharacterized protein MANES_17G101400 n=1 Tax=Rhizophora mucronata TaxID=61149 RepID=A0A2P2JNA2_RHIMU
MSNIGASSAALHGPPPTMSSSKLLAPMARS